MKGKKRWREAVERRTWCPIVEERKDFSVQDEGERRTLKHTSLHKHSQTVFNHSSYI